MEDGFMFEKWSFQPREDAPCDCPEFLHSHGKDRCKESGSRSYHGLLVCAPCLELLEETDKDF